MDKRKQLCVVFDIDETLIHYVSKKYKPLVDGMDPELKTKYRAIESGEDIVLFRPYIEELFTYFKSTPDIRVGLWTYSEREYANNIAKILTNMFDLSEDFFLFKWGDEDMARSEDEIPKDLTAVYAEFPDFNTFNTFIVDDLYKNIKHDINKENCILIQPFAPFGTSKVRTSISEEQQSMISNDSVFNDLIDICQKVLNDIKNCDEEDIDYAFSTEPVFVKKRINRMGLQQYLKTYAYNFINLMTIGQPNEVNDFFMVNRDNYPVYKKGGKRTKRRRSNRRRSNRRRSNRRRSNRRR
jgi:hypothetical protein